MQNCFTFIDVELANPSHDSICALGIIHVRDGNTVFSHEYIIDPACSFSSFHTNLHGITPEICNGKPCFPDVWKEVSSYFEAGIVVAHSATSMDLNAICQTLMHYQLPVPEIHYLCTLELAKKYIPKKVSPTIHSPAYATIWASCSTPSQCARRCPDVPRCILRHAFSLWLLR